MQVKTLLNRVHPIRGFVYEQESIVGDPDEPNGCRLDVQVRARRRSRPVCSGCGHRSRTYDHQPARRFEFVPLWGLAVFLVYAMRRADCPRCGVTVEWVPWLEPGSKRPVTQAMEWFLARWARRLSWTEVARAFNVSWDRVHRSVSAAVAWGLQRRDLSAIEAIGVDEVAYAKGHRYATLVYQLDQGRRRLLHVSEGRSAKSLLRFFRMLGRERSARIRFVCSDMWKAYLKVIGKKVPQAVHILDRYHIVANLNKAIDQIRAEEARRLKAEGCHILKHTRWLFLRRATTLKTKPRQRLRELLYWDLKTVRAWRLKESLQALWEYKSPTHASRFLETWCRSAMRSQLEPMKRVARSLRSHHELIINWFRAKKQYNAGIVEGLNANVKLRFRKARGFRTFDAIEVALYHELADLPEPCFTHRFC